MTQVSTCMTGAAPACIGTADEIVTAYTYEASNQPNNVRLLSKTVRSGNGVLSATTSYAYNDRGDVVAVDGPLPGADDTTREAYDASRWQIAEVTPDPDGAGSLKARATKTTYRADGQVSLVQHGQVSSPTDIGLTTFGSQQEVQTAYDDQARPRMVTNIGFGEFNNISQTSYDQLGRVQCQTVRMNPAVFSSLPLSACDLSTAGAYGQDRITYSEYDSIGRLTRVTSGYRSASPRVEKEVRLYTPNGQEGTVADGNGNLTTYTYDALDRLAIVNYPNVAGGGSSASDYEQYGYDAAGNRTTWRRRDGKTIVFTYDALNRMVLKDLPDAWPDITYGYDNLDRQSAVGPTGASQVNIATMTYDALGCLVTQVSPGAPNSNYGVGTACDQAGRRTSMTYPNGAALTYTYDTLGELTGIWEGTGTSVNLATYAYDDLGRRTVLHYANGTEQRYGYDGISRLKTLTHDLAGMAQDQTWSYAYNPANQVTARTSANAALYDWNGAQSSRTYGVNGLNQLTNSVGAASETYGYDARGNLTSSGAKAYTYDIENRLISTSDGQLSYDPLGRLSAIIPVSGAPVYFAYDGSDVVAEYGGPGQLLRRYVNGPGTDDPIVTYDGSDLTQKRWLMPDAQGSIVSASDATGAAQAPNTYDEYGIAGQANQGRFQYTGQMWMAELGLYNYKARIYSPTLGRFLQTDPIGYGDGLNWYAYVDNDPMNRTDSSGTQNVTINATGANAIYSTNIPVETPVNNWGAPNVAPVGTNPNGAGRSSSPNPYVGTSVQFASKSGQAPSKAQIQNAQANLDADRGDAEGYCPPGMGGDIQIKRRYGGESSAAAYGRQAHLNYRDALGARYDFNARLPSGKRPDGINWGGNVVRELKPDSPSGISRGVRQLEGYRRELESITGQPWTSELDLYRRPK